jgi:DNA polymerase I-like protein with 3'-5' exonuclease and polymerase domains
MSFEEIKITKPHSKLCSPRNSTQYILAGPKTFRRASRKILSNKKETPYHNFGSNLQNIEKKLRKVYIADKGYKLGQVDQSGADALIVAHLCKSGKYRSLFQNGIKPHTYMALKLFPDEWKKHTNSSDVDEAINTPIESLAKLSFWKSLGKLIKSSDDWPPNKRFYYIGKKVIHASSYGMHGNRLRTVILEETYGQILLEPTEAESYILKFHKEFPEIQQWHFRVQSQVKQNQQIRNLFGWPFNVTSFVSDTEMKDLIAWAPQSTVAAITQIALTEFQEYVELNNKDWHILAETHDSIMIEAPENEIIEAISLLKSFIEQELKSPIDGTIFRMKSEAQIGYNWAPYDEQYNPEGLKEAA